MAYFQLHGQIWGPPRGYQNLGKIKKKVPLKYNVSKKPEKKLFWATLLDKPYFFHFGEMKKIPLKFQNFWPFCDPTDL